MTATAPLRRALSSVAALAGAAGVLAGCSSGADAAAGTTPACAGLAGETVSLVVPYEPGGGYDAYARLIGPYLEDATGATIAVENRPGAGGLLALNNLLTEEPDGTTIAIMNGVGAGGSSIAGADGATFALDDFTYIGRVASEPPLVVTSATGNYQTFDAVRAARGFRWGSTGPGAEDYVTASVLSAVFDIDAQVVTGFPGSGETELAVLQGSIDGMSGNPGSRRQAVEEGTQTAVLLMGEEKPGWLAGDVPSVADVPMSQEQASIVDAHLALIEIGRPLVGPPGMDEEITTCWREGMAAAMANPDLQAEAQEQERELGFLAGAELDALVQRLVDAPPAYRELLATLY
ncbi:tripartite-type tricarboxylate transporter receptor subunit TctC [Pseudonocardia hierapolitana]|uniref:Tripartite-type tricarboxylate transporter receptor subunit TctC n=1 Tax=Pseudonocardia hierapolitana TaxID=1128676 RepID=A0A561T4U1_9PSEU|nr:tripartite tricarboxylate transporter substrate-binding protein [Pseudonocardia hierapolitana]TWF82128.1 tripartite-type tricarboxylate transporter receptor subunit TctC [Pseudonocardia hierapolitana]